jgi:hypothetical protein
LRLRKVFHLFAVVLFIPEDAAALQGLTQRNALMVQGQEEAGSRLSGVIDMIVIVALAQAVT